MIDSSKFIDWMRQGRNPTRILRPFVLANQIVSCGVIRVEVVRGAVKPTVKAELTTLFDAIRDVAMTSGIWKRITELGWQLDRQGTVLPVSDLIIGACALLEGATVVTTDSHFQQIPDLNIREDLPDWD
ncbi:MAG: PIN domain-containing protein [Kiritimatiellia bacterium]|nr:PIN domain-containing protein [Kiritimatiellia bacterium]